MSTAPKRSHEETVQSSSKPPHQDSGSYSKLIPPVPNDSHVPYEIGQDSRAAKVPRVEVPRVEAREADRKSPVHSVYRAPLSSNDSHADNPIGTENRIESRDLKDNRDPRFEIRDMKTEKETYGEARRDSQVAKSEKDVRVGNRGDDNKGIRYERDSRTDPKGDLKTENGLVSSPLNWKESREYKGKRYSDAPSGSLDSWHTSRGNTTAEVGKENSTAEERDNLEAREAVVESKTDSKSEDRYKDRKRKDVKHRDLGDKEKERSDQGNSTQVNNIIGDNKESIKEDRGVEKWERERKDIPTAKEISKESEKDHSKKESSNGMEKEVSINEKELGDGSAKITEPKAALPEQKKQKDVDSWKNVDGKAGERRKERDADLEVDRPDKRPKFDKQSEDGCSAVEGAGEKEGEVHNSNVQHRKRLQRSRGSPQVASREACFKSHDQNNGG